MSIKRRLRERIYHAFNMQCSIHTESHLNDLSPENLATLRAMGVRHLSMGVEALQDHHLRTLGRPYIAAEALAALDRAVAQDFECVNVDLIFALPDQTLDELRQAGRALSTRRWPGCDLPALHFPVHTVDARPCARAQPAADLWGASRRDAWPEQVVL